MLSICAMKNRKTPLEKGPGTPLETVTLKKIL